MAAGIDTVEIELQIRAHLRFSKHILHIWKYLSNSYTKSILNFFKYTKNIINYIENVVCTKIS